MSTAFFVGLLLLIALLAGTAYYKRDEEGKKPNLIVKICRVFLALIFTALLLPVLLDAIGVGSTLYRLDCVVPNYKWCIGLRAEYPDCEYILKKYGEPDEIVYEKREFEDGDEDYTINLIYADEMLTFKCGTDNVEEPESRKDWTLYTIKTENPKHKFGKARIHIGSSRAEVIAAYSKATAVIEYELGEYYFDGVWDDSVKFTYNENDKVTAIEFVKDI